MTELAEATCVDQGEERAVPAALISVSLETFRKSMLDCDLYIRQGPDNALSLYRKKSQTLDAENLDRLAKRGIDELYVPGGNDPVLAADAFTLLFLLNGIPPGATVNQLGVSLLNASSNTGSGTPGTVITGAGETGLDAIVGSEGGRMDSQGSYRVVALSAQVAILKSAVVVDPFGGSQPVAGSTITYQLSVIATGTGTTHDVTVSDAIPLNTTYNPGTLMLNGSPVTDAVDGDPGDMGGTTPGAVTVTLGDVAVSGPDQSITFTVTID